MEYIFKFLAFNIGQYIGVSLTISDLIIYFVMGYIIVHIIKNNKINDKENDIDGVKIDFPQGWVHLRKSNTEPIVRIYSEAPTEEQAMEFANAVIAEIKRIAGI